MVTDRREHHDYYECPRCGRTVVVMYDSPEPAVALTCDDGHDRLSMNSTNLGN